MRTEIATIAKATPIESTSRHVVGRKGDDDDEEDIVVEKKKDEWCVKHLSISINLKNENDM